MELGGWLFGWLQKGDLGADMRMTLNLMLKGTVDWSDSGCGHIAGSCERSNESMDSIKYGEFIDQLSDF